MKEPRRPVLPTCGVRLSRRSAVKQVGGWAIYVGVATVAACGRTPLGDPLGEFIGDDDDDDDAVTTQTPTPTATETPVPCTCTPVQGALLGLNASDVDVGTFAVNSALKLFVCHDAAGYYAMSDACTHSGTHIIDNGSFNPGNLDAGFTCGLHGSHFQGDGLHGSSDAGPAPVNSSLVHYLLTIDGAGELYIDLTVVVDRSCRCTS